MMVTEKYNPEKYWSEVGGRIEERSDGKNIIAGDDEPYYRYKRKEFLRLLHEVSFTGKKVLEIGHGPGGNLLEVWKHQPSSLTGADISNQMIKLARSKCPEEINLVKIDGKKLPFEDNSFDTAFTATVLQHNTDEKMLTNLVQEIGRVSQDKVYFFERIEDTIKGDELCLGRPVAYYEKLMADQGYKLVEKKFINIRVSYYVSGFIRKFLNSQSRKEGEPLNNFSVGMQKITLPFTKVLDKVFTSNKDLCRLTFARKK